MFSMTKKAIVNRILNEKHNPPHKLGSLGRAFRAYALGERRAKRA